MNGLPDGGTVNVVREDPARKGLLYCGTEQAVYVSFDDGDRWEPLRLNMPATSIRDLIVKDKDLAVATHGRGFWILDDISPLRQFPTFAAGRAALLRPAPALRVRFDTNTDTPLPPDEPAGNNPPDGAVLDYWLAQPAPGPVVLEILDANGRVVRSAFLRPAPGCTGSSGTCTGRLRRRSSPPTRLRPSRTTLPASREVRGRCPAPTRSGSRSRAPRSPSRSTWGWTRA